VLDANGKVIGIVDQIATADSSSGTAGVAVGDSTDLVAAIATHEPGDQVQLTVRRGSSTEHLTVTLGTQPTQAASNGG
jgi:S1-C subfamily serine protease